MDWALGLSAGLWWFLCISALLGWVYLRDLPPVEAVEGAVETLWVVVPVRDEVKRIEGCLRSLLGQEGVRCEVVAVDDRSTDGTSEVIARLAAEEPRLHAVRVDELPDGWLGKCHACHLGAQRAAGEYLLFTDADAHFAADTCARALAEARRLQADHFVLLPGLGRVSIPGQAAVLLASTALLAQVGYIHAGLPFGYTGVGAFTLMRREWYAKIGGHERLRLEVVEDMALGWLTRRYGGCSRLRAACADVHVAWVDSARGFVRLIEKNMFAKLGFAPWVAAVQVLLMTGSLVLPLYGLWLGHPAGWIALAGMLGLGLPALAMARRYGFAAISALCCALAMPVLIWTTCRSTLLVLRRGGVRWRDTFYPLAELRGFATDLRRSVANTPLRNL